MYLRDVTVLNQSNYIVATEANFKGDKIHVNIQHIMYCVMSYV